jgi:hypothetical protein
MKRIDIYYGSRHYSVADREVEDLKRQVADALRGDGDWIEVNYGEGSRTAAFVFLTPGVDIAIVPIPKSEDY